MEIHSKKLSFCVAYKRISHHNFMSHYAVELFNSAFDELLALIVSHLLTFHSVSCFFLCSSVVFVSRILSFFYLSFSVYIFSVVCIAIQGKRTSKNFIVFHLFVFKLVTRLDIKLKTSYKYSIWFLFILFYAVVGVFFSSSFSRLSLFVPFAYDCRTTPTER